MKELFLSFDDPENCMDLLTLRSLNDSKKPMGYKYLRDKFICACEIMDFIYYKRKCRTLYELLTNARYLNK